jgi:hypothetical protein
MVHTSFKETCNIYHLSLESGIFPDQLKVAEFIPLYKNDIGNYRQIAQLSVFFSYLLEKLTYNRFMTFIERHEALKHSVTVLRPSTQKAIEKKINQVRMFLDLTKAYDVLRHWILLSKWNSYGIRGVANLLYQSYISNWKQCVEGNTWKQVSMFQLQGKLNRVCLRVQFLVQYYSYYT